MHSKITLRHIVENPDPTGRELDLDDPYDKEEYIIQLTIKAMKDQIDKQVQHNCITNCPKCGHDLTNCYICDDSEDPDYRPAIKFVIDTQKASAAMLQRKFRIGYARAARLIDRMEEDGIVGPADGINPREVLVDSICDKPHSSDDK